MYDRSINIFVDTDMSLESLAQVVEKVVGITLTLKTLKPNNPAFPSYEAFIFFDQEQDWGIMITNNGLIGANDITDNYTRITNFPYRIECFSLKRPLPENNATEKVIQVSRSIFEGLKMNHQCSLGMLYEIDIVRDEYYPQND
ncbi:MAG: hypothetical protein JNJ61_19200 [Anaerolineae bacterium]|nr:hypothetical protein [Anaerolineae bacterium]